ncbi:MAG: transposase [Candidatus Omnitrophica bacterium]|nr:transposase [Candidatus Omnitrophota bacterium]MBU2044747.1 transposase [Candidatus Omnitrophota bacterium]MBU2473890.1 transposase [Candidatus Omnitrophota bacterium]
MPVRKIPLAIGETYHILSKSIAGYTIFRDDKECERMRALFKYYQVENPAFKFSVFFNAKNQQKFNQKYSVSKEKLVEVICYCIMPTHIHLVLQQLRKDGVVQYMNNILNSYSHYFNIKTGRKGPLWESRFSNVLVETDEQLAHLTRYIHLNPTTAYLVSKPQNWSFSSYQEFLGLIKEGQGLCNYSELMHVVPESYPEFVNSQIDYQRELADIKRLFLE